MWLLMLVLMLPAWSQEEDDFEDLDLETLQKLDEELPSAILKSNITPDSNKAEHPIVHVQLSEIVDSNVGYGVVQPGRTLIRISDGKKFKITQSFTTKYYLKEDELGFKHLIDKNGNSLYKIDSPHVISINQELELYEPPLRYTTATKNMTRAEYDTKLKVYPEASFYLGFVQGDYMKDLFNDPKASQGQSTQYGFHYFTEWKMPVKAGIALHFEKSTYQLSDGGQINYSAFSFGPQFKTKNFDFAGLPLRIQTQFRVSPFASAHGETSRGSESYKFNSADFLTSVEHPLSNQLGEFVIGLFFQSQWLNIKDQNKNVSINPSNAINKSFGLSFAQVFQ